MPLWGVEMKLDTFAVPFTADRRMAYAAAYLEQCSYRQVEEVQAAWGARGRWTGPARTFHSMPAGA